MNKSTIKNMLYKNNLKSRELNILLYLIDRCNDEFTCFPSIKTISKNLKISVSTVKRALNTLISDNYIVKVERYLDTNGRQTSNLYIINLDVIENNSKVEEKEEKRKKKML